MRAQATFVLGLTRGVGFQSSAKADVNCPAGLAYRIQTNRRPEAVSLNVVIWAGGDDVRQLVRYGGLTIFTGRNTRRKVQLRSLGLIRSGTVAGVPIYDLAANYNTYPWAITRTSPNRRLPCDETPYGVNVRLKYARGRI